MKRMLLLFAVVALMAAVLAPTALAEKPVPDPDCTFEKGKTTCVKDVVTSTTYGTEVLSQYRQSCGFLSTRSVTVYGYYKYDHYSTVTTVYRGKTDTVLSTSSEFAYTRETLLSQTTVYGSCGS